MSLKVRLKVNGIDRQDNLLERDWEIESNAYGDMDIAEFILHDSDLSLSLVGGETVIIEDFNDASNRLFGGVLTQAAIRRDGSLGRLYQCKALDWTFVLERALVSGTYRGRPDDEIINGAAPPSGSDQGVFLISDTDLSDFDDTTHVQQGIANTQFMQFKRRSIRDVMDALAEQAGFVWRVDSQKNIHYKPFGAEAHAFGLSDSPDSLTTYPFMGAARVLDVSQLVNAVTVEGAHKRKADQTVIYPANGIAMKLSGLAFWQAKSGQTRIVVERNTGDDITPAWTAQFVGLKGDATDEAAFGVTLDVLWNPGARVLEWYTAPPNLTNSYRVSGDQLIPLIHKEPDESSIVTYGREYGLAIKDESLKDEEQVVLRAMAELRKHSTSSERISCRTLKDGISAGRAISFKWTAGAVATATDYLVQKVITRLLGGQVAEYELTLVRKPA